MPQRGCSTRPAVWPAVFLGLLIAGWPGLPRAAPLDPFRVSEVKVDATADSAAKARGLALSAGQKQAFAKLLRRMTLRRDLARLPQPSAKQITDLVGGLEIDSERASGIRYIAELSVRFKPAGVRALLRAARIDFVETPSLPVLVLPVYDGPSGTVLWDEPNPWRRAWARLAPRGGLVPFAQALGDLSDFQLIEASQVIEDDALALTRIAERYEAAHVLIVIARARRTGAAGQIVVEIDVSQFEVAARETQIVGSFRGAVGDDEDRVFELTAAAVAAEIEERWKLNNIVLSGPESRIVVQVPIAGFEQWLEVRRRLEAVALIRGDRLLHLSRRWANLEIAYLGNVGRLAKALGQNHLILSRESRVSGSAALLPEAGRSSRPDWTLRLDGSIAPAPAKAVEQ